MKEASYYKKLKNKLVQCTLCPNFCTLKNEELGKCNARQNINGKLISLSYRRPISICVDPIEKKPLYHFLPGSKALSLGTAGCNLHCDWCQNWQISQIIPSEAQVEISPQQIVSEAKRRDCKSIAYTYTEGTIFFEYMLEIAKLAKKARIKNVLVSNGYINPEPLREIIKYVDAANIDLKSMSDSVYQKYCGVKVTPILKTIKTLAKSKVWLEITNLLVPGVNDKDAQIKKLISWVKANCGTKVPLHFSAYYPAYKMHAPPTPASTVKRARELALKAGLKYVYCGNI